MSTSKVSPVELQPLAYDVAAAGRIAGLGRSTLYEEITAGRLRSFTVGRRRLVSHDALTAWVRDREAEATAP